tara:strand:- start:9020 stop:9238 length:219 start_codon:yes stop_codon:yes gene_type:complete
MGKQNNKLIKNMNKLNTVSECCKADYEDAEGSACCGAKISLTGLCYECHEHTETDGYFCEDCGQWFEKTITV